MEPLGLSECWNGWTNLGVIVAAARAAAAAGPLDPLRCDVTLEWDEDDDTTLHSLDELQELLGGGAEPSALEIAVSHAVQSEAAVAIVFNGRWLQLNGSGSDWTRARRAYDAAQVELALEYGITTFRLPELPRNTVAETRKRLSEPDI